MIIKMELPDNRPVENVVLSKDLHLGEGDNITMKGKRPWWKFIDCLRDVEVREVGSMEGYIQPNTMIDMYVNICENSSSDSRVLVTARHILDDSEVAILCDYTMYLLNDIGKTIERLN